MKHDPPCTPNLLYISKKQTTPLEDVHEKKQTVLLWSPPTTTTTSSPTQVVVKLQVEVMRLFHALPVR